MAENHKIKIRNNLQINFHNHISKPNYLITINPDKFLQKSTYNSAMSIKERDELNPEMAEIVRKILLKRKKNKNKKNLSFIKDRKDNSLRKYFDDNYNKKHGINKENYYNNQTLILDSLNDRVGNNNKNVRFFDYINKSVNNKIKIMRKKKANANIGSYSVPRYKNISLDKLKIPQSQILNYSSIQGEPKIDDTNLDYKGYKAGYIFHKKLNKTLNLELNDESINNNNNDINNTLKLNSIILDDDKINKDESIMEIKCDYSYNDIISPRDLIYTRKNQSDKKNFNIKKKKSNYIDDKNIEKESNTIKNSYSKRIYESNSIKKKPLNLNKKNNLENIKVYNKHKIQPVINKKVKRNKYVFNNSQEHRTRYDKYELIKTSQVNKNINNQFNLTITNNFFKNNLNINNINNNFIKINNSKQATRVNNSANKRNRNIYIPKTNVKFRKMKSKNSYNNVPNNNINMLNNKLKSSPFHSKNSSKLSSELSQNNKNKKVKKIKMNNSSKKSEISKKSLFNNKKVNFKENKDLKLNCKKKKIQKTDVGKERQNNLEKSNSKSKYNTSINDDNNSLGYQKLLKNDSNNSLFDYDKILNLQKSNKKEYPNMALFSNRETKYIKKIESLCKKGYSGPGIKKTNQDNFFIYNNFNNNSNYVYLGVCDGHGLFGQDISTYLVNKLPQNMNKKIISKNIKNLSNADITLLSSIFQETFVETNISLNSDERIDSSYSGSTCVSLLFTPTRIYCINVGDSRCLLGKYIEKENKWISMNLSRDHKPSEPDEMIRIKKCGGIIESYRDNSGNFVGPERVWGPSMEAPGLAMSRSFGDEIGHQVGVVVDPEVLEHFFEKEDKFIILGSDGIWEFISNEEVIDIVKDYYLENNIEGAIEHLYNEASKRWIMEEEVIDDITVIIIFLN